MWLELLGQVHWAFCSVGMICAVLFSVLLVLRERALRRPAPADLPPITMLKPFDGVDPELEANFWSWIDTDYPAPRQILFATDRDNGDGIAIVERVLGALAAFPREGVTASLLLPSAGEPPLLTRKIWHMHRAYGHAVHDVIVNTDSGTRAVPGLLPALVGTLLADPRRGASYAAYTASGDGAIGERLSRLAWTATGMDFRVVDAIGAAVRRAPVLVGGCFAVRRQVADQLDGFLAGDRHITEDIELGRRIADAGWDVVPCPLRVVRHMEGATIREFVDRQLRWNVTVWRFKDSLRFPYPLVMGGLAAAPFTFLLAASAFPERRVEYALGTIGLFVGRFAFGLFAARRAGLRASDLALLPLVDAILLATWAWAPFVRTIAWRGVRLRVGESGRVERG
jgi:ceramide glucosyltransferase